MNIRKINISQDELRKILNYDHVTGEFTWKYLSKHSKHLLGKKAGYVRNGYLFIQLGKLGQFPAHRIAFIYMTGKEPEIIVDHIDGNGLNNAWSNLRESSFSQNQQNIRKPNLDNKVGLLGVSCKKGRYFAQISFNGNKKHIGYFDTAEEAHQAYLSKKRELHEYCTI